MKPEGVTSRNKFGHRVGISSLVVIPCNGLVKVETFVYIPVFQPC